MKAITESESVADCYRNPPEKLLYHTLMPQVIRMISFSAGTTTFRGCWSGRDGGAIFALSPCTLRDSGSQPSTLLDSNAAAGCGGAITSWKSLSLEYGHRLRIHNNSAGLYGGGVCLEGGSVLSVLDEGCQPAVCSALARGNGQCDPGCMNRACNW
jgi:hypothetical protein